MKSNFKKETPGPRSLSDLRPGQSARVIGVDEDGPSARRLLDFGLLPNTPVRAIQRAPLGSPTLYEFRGYRLCLRDEHAALVTVRIDAEPAEATSGNGGALPRAAAEAPERTTP